MTNILRRPDEGKTNIQTWQFKSVGEMLKPSRGEKTFAVQSSPDTNTTIVQTARGEFYLGNSPTWLGTPVLQGPRHHNVQRLLPEANEVNAGSEGVSLHSSRAFFES